MEKYSLYSFEEAASYKKGVIAMTPTAGPLAFDRALAQARCHLSAEAIDAAFAVANLLMNPSEAQRHYVRRMVSRASRTSAGRRQVNVRDGKDARFYVRLKTTARAKSRKIMKMRYA